jgi:hypothetical protein
MRFLRITTASADYVRCFYAARPGLEKRSHADQYAAFFGDHFAWGNSLKSPLENLGYAYLGIDSAAAPLLAQWGAENMAGSESLSPLNLLVEQARRFAPEVMMFNSPDAALLAAIKAACPSLRLTFGWVGSALGLKELWREMDLILSCAPESVEELRRRGASAEHLDHGFDPQLNEHPPRPGPELDVTFVGTIVRRGQYHLEREELLEMMARDLPLVIFTPRTASSARDYAKALFSGGLHAAASVLSAMRLLDPVRRNWHWLDRILPFASPLKLPVNRRLAKISRSAVYGLDYYSVLRRSRVSLNIHADSSPRFASNIRLFEATGVGSCLLTDWKPNLGHLFEVDREVVAYRSAEECRSNARWLLEHPRERAEIAQRGQARALRDHNFDIRARQLDEIIKFHLRGNRVRTGRAEVRSPTLSKGVPAPSYQAEGRE